MSCTSSYYWEISTSIVCTFRSLRENLENCLFNLKQIFFLGTNFLSEAIRKNCEILWMLTNTTRTKRLSKNLFSWVKNRLENKPETTSFQLRSGPKWSYRTTIKEKQSLALLYLYRARNKVTQLSIPTHAQLQCHWLKFI